MVVIDFSTPPWLITYFHIIGIISICLNSLGLYLLLYQNNKLDKIRYYMLAYQIIVFLTDVHLTFLMQPVALFPMFAGYTVGLLVTWFDTSIHFSMMAVMVLVVVQLEFLNLCFKMKHQTIAKTLNTHVLPDWFWRCIDVVCVLCPTCLALWFHTLRLTKHEQWKVIRKDWPQYIHEFEKLSNFDIYVKTWWFILMMLTIIGGGIVVASFFFLFSFDLLHMMSSLKSKISANRYQRHKEAIQNLIVQFATSSFCVVPPVCLTIVIMSELEQAQLFSTLCILWFSTHSSANMISLLIFFPPYRNFILGKLRLKTVLTSGTKASTTVQPFGAIRNPEQRSNLSAVEVS